MFWSTIIKMKEIAIVDIETSGFQDKGGLIVEIGIVGLNLETGVVTNEFDSNLNRFAQKPLELRVIFKSEI